MRRSDLVWLGAVCLCEMATMLVFLNYTAILPILQVEWGMGHGEAGLIFSAFGILALGVLMGPVSMLAPRRAQRE